MCANCVSNLDAVAGGIAAAGYVLKDRIHEGLVAVGVLSEPHPLAVDMRTTNFLRSLDLDAAAVLGPDVVAAVDRAQAFALRPVYRRTFREALALIVPGSSRSQRALATK
jgi:hypothetical protein